MIYKIKIKLNSFNLPCWILRGGQRPFVSCWSNWRLRHCCLRGTEAVSLNWIVISLTSKRPINAWKLIDGPPPYGIHHLTAWQLMNSMDHVWLPFHGVHCGQNILIGWEGDKEGKGNQPETYCEICHHLKNEFRDDKNRTADATCKQGQGIITHLTEWIIILSKVWKGEIVVHQDLKIRFGNGFLNI